MALDPLQVAHARLMKRFFVWGERLYHWLPRGLHPRAARCLAEAFTPSARDLWAIGASMQWALELDDADAHRALDRWLANQGAWGLDLNDYPGLPAGWTQAVHCNERSLVQDLLRDGGLVLSYHSQHHNRLGAYLGDSGSTVWGVAGPEQGSPYEPWTGPFIRRINGGSAARFGGGRYVFTDDLRGLARQCRQGLERGQAVVSVADVPLASPQSIGVPVFGRELPVATGLIDLALELGAPIWAALFFSDLRGGHVLRLTRLAPGRSGAAAADVVRAYGTQLEVWLRQEPWVWQGWGWWLNLPAVDARVEGTPVVIAERLDRLREGRPAASAGARTLLRLGSWQERCAPLMTP